MGRKTVRGTDKNNRLTAGANTDVYVGGGNDTVILQGDGNVYGYRGNRIYIDNNDGQNDIYGFSNYRGDTLNLINGSITDYGMKGQDIFFKNGKTTVWLRNPEKTMSSFDGYNTTGFNVVYKKWQKYSNVNFTYCFANDINGANFNYNPWSRYFGSQRGYDILTAREDSLKYESKPDPLSQSEVKNPHIDLRDTTKFRNIDEVNAVNTKGAVVHGAKTFITLLGSKSGADELWAGTGGARLLGNGGKGTDIYHGGSSADNFYHGVLGKDYKTIKSNEIVYGYTSGMDEIDYKGKFQGGKVSGRDVILSFSNGTMRVKDGVGKAIDLYSMDNHSDIIRTFGTPVLAKGLSYQNNRQKLVIKTPYKGTLKWGTYDSTVKEIDARTVKSALNIDGNPGNEVIRAGQGGGTIWGSKGNDTIYGGKGVDTFVYHRKGLDDEADGQDKIYNYESGKDIIRIGSNNYSLSAVGNDVIMKIGGHYNDSVRIVNGVLKNIVIQGANGKKVTKKVYPNPPAYALYNKKTGTVTFNSKTPAITFDAKKYDPSIRNFDGRAVNKRLNITGNAQNNNIYAGKASGVLSGLGGNDTLYGNNGVDTFRYTSGADTIVNYQSDRDVIQLASGSVTGHKVWGSDVTLNIGKGKILVKNGVNKNILVKDVKGKTRNYKYGYLNLPATAVLDEKKTEVTLKSNAVGTFDAAGYNPEIETIDAQAAQSAVNICGNSKNNTIYASDKGGTLQGRSGDDVLYGGAGKDTFVYANGDGNDVIYSYTSKQDVIKLLSGKIDSYRLEGNDVILRNGKGSIRVKDAVNKKITFADAKGNISTHTYTNVIRASKAGGRLRGNGADNIFYGNVGKDTFVYGAGDGNMTIYDYASGRDIIYLEAGSVKSWTSKGNDAIISVGEKSITIKDGVNREVIVQTKSGAHYVFPKNTKNAMVLADGITYDTDKHLVYMPEEDGYSASPDSDGEDFVVNTWSGKEFRIKGMGNSPINIQDNSGTITGYCGEKPFYGMYFDIERKALIISNETYMYNEGIPKGYNIVDARNSDGDVYIYGFNEFNEFNAQWVTKDEVFYGGKGKTEFYGNGGNDNFYGGTGEDIIHFDVTSGSNYTVHNYDTNKDKIVLDYDGYKGYYIKGNDVIIKCYDALMTVKNTNVNDINIQYNQDYIEEDWRKKHIFDYSSSDGDIIIRDYDSECDRIYLEDGNIESWTSNGDDVILSVGMHTITIKDGVNRKVTVQMKDIDYIFPEGTKNAQVLAEGVIYDSDKYLVYMPNESVYYTAVSGEDLLVVTNDNKEICIPGVANIPINIEDSSGKMGYWRNNQLGYGVYFDFERKAIIADCDYVNISLSSSEIPDGYHIVDARNSERDGFLSGSSNDDILYGGKGTTAFRGYGGADVFYAGSGKDTFHFGYYETEHYTIYDYDKTKDQICLDDYDGYMVDGKDVIFKYRDSTMTVKNVNVKDINVENDVRGDWREKVIKPSAQDAYIAGKNNLAYLSQMQGIGSAKADSLMHLSAKANNMSSNITLAGHGQSTAITMKKTV